MSRTPLDAPQPRGIRECTDASQTPVSGIVCTHRFGGKRLLVTGIMLPTRRAKFVPYHRPPSAGRRLWPLNSGRSLALFASANGRVNGDRQRRRDRARAADCRAQVSAARQPCERHTRCQDGGPYPPRLEALYVLAGRLSKERPMVTGALQPVKTMPGHDAGTPMEVPSTGATNLSVLVMFVVDAAKPFSSPADLEYSRHRRVTFVGSYTTS